MIPDSARGADGASGHAGAELHEMITVRGRWRAVHYLGDWTPEQIDAGLAPVALDDAGRPMIYEGENILVNAGIALMEDLLIGAGGTVFSNANAYIGVGTANPTALAGTVSVTNGSASVAGSGTSFTTALNVGDMIRVDSDGTWYKVAAIGSNTALTLTASYTGTTASGQAASKDTLNATQTDLTGASKVRNGMDATFPSRSGQTLSWRTTLSTAQGNFAINEAAVFNAAAAGTMFNRLTKYLGTKTSATTMQVSCDVTIS